MSQITGGKASYASHRLSWERWGAHQGKTSRVAGSIGKEIKATLQRKKDPKMAEQAIARLIRPGRAGETASSHIN